MLDLDMLERLARAANEAVDPSHAQARESLLDEIGDVPRTLLELIARIRELESERRDGQLERAFYR